MTKLVASMNVHNELDRYLPLVIERLRDYCDEIRVQDDGSTDGSYEWLSEQPKVEVKRNEGPSWTENEGVLHQNLLDWTLKGAPTHILAIDADEIVPRGDEIRQYIEGPTKTRAFALEMHEVWRTDTDPWMVRIDGGWRPHPVAILYKVPRELTIRGISRGEWKIWGRKMAGGRVPRIIRTDQHQGRFMKLPDIDILHLGWSKPEERKPRHARYVELDGGAFHASDHLDSIMYPDEMITTIPYPGLTRTGVPVG